MQTKTAATTGAERGRARLMAMQASTIRTHRQAALDAIDGALEYLADDAGCMLISGTLMQVPVLDTETRTGWPMEKWSAAGQGPR